jgi:hypothetical protein
MERATEQTMPDALIVHAHGSPGNRGADAAAHSFGSEEGRWGDWWR